MDLSEVWLSLRFLNIYPTIGLGCLACRPGFYKAFAGNVKCSKCPPHSLTYVEATSVCQCEKGYFRAEKDPPTMACTRPPSAPRNVIFNINETALMLEWSPPSDTGGRKDLTYSVICKKCGSDTSQCEICGGGIRFIPRHTGLINSSVTVLDFVSHVNYTFEIEATNGVSELSFSPKQFTAITVTTDQDERILQTKRHSTAVGYTEMDAFEMVSPSLIGMVRKDWASQNSIALSWQEPDFPHGAILDYEIKYYEKEHEQLSYSTTRSKAPSVIVTGLKPATKYIFHIRVRTAAGYSGYSQKFEFETGDETSDMAAEQGQILVIATAAVGGFTLLVILTLFFLITGSYFSIRLEGASLYSCMCSIEPRIVQEKQCKFLDMPYSRTQGILAVPENDGLLDPAKAIWHQPTIAMVISKEADRNYQSLVNGFGYFCSYIAPGSRVVQADQKRTKQHSPPGPILREKDLKVRFPGIKTYIDPDTYEDPSLAVHEFAKEIDPSRIRIERVIGAGRPVMIVVEYMENGSLDSFLRVRCHFLMTFE
ncbi:hypothetical protein Q9233_013608 [Columba guinea]|nr:hypothetical protein Q9233_013608 [Columba guinea]